MGSRHKGRVFALQAIYSYEMNTISKDELLTFEWINGEQRETVPEDTLLFATLLVSGTVDHLADIDEVIKNHLEHWDFTRISKVDLAVLRLGVYSLMYQADIPATVTINEAIDLAKEFSTDDSYRFINGMLDGIKRALDNKSLKQKKT